MTDPRYPRLAQQAADEADLAKQASSACNAGLACRFDASVRAVRADGSDGIRSTRQRVSRRTRGVGGGQGHHQPWQRLTFRMLEWGLAARVISPSGCSSRGGSMSAGWSAIGRWGRSWRRGGLVVGAVAVRRVPLGNGAGCDPRARQVGAARSRPRRDAALPRTVKSAYVGIAWPCAAASSVFRLSRLESRRTYCAAGASWIPARWRHRGRRPGSPNAIRRTEGVEPERVVRGPEPLKAVARPRMSRSGTTTSVLQQPGGVEGRWPGSALAGHPRSFVPRWRAAGRPERDGRGVDISQSRPSFPCCVWRCQRGLSR